jgi:hypothetical protein
MSITVPAAAAGQWGLRIAVASATKAYLTDRTPAALTAYRARFSLDPRSFSTGNAAIDLLTGLDAKGKAILRLQYRKAATGQPQIQLGASRASGTTWTGWTSLSDGRHAIELGWSSAASAEIRLWIDGGAGPSASGLDTRAYRLDTVTLGPSAGLSKSMTGELFFDRFVSTRGSAIGP